MAAVNEGVEKALSSGWTVEVVRAPTARILGAPRWVQIVGGLLLYCLLFALSFYLGRVFTKGYEGSLWYPGAGLRLAALLAFGWRILPGVVVVEMLAIYWADRWGAGRYQELSQLLPVALTPIFYGLGAEWLRRRIDTRLHFTRDVAWLVFAGLALPLVVALITRFGNALIGALPANLVLPSALSFWIGDAIGILMLTPALLLLRARMLDPLHEETPWKPVPLRSLVLDFVLVWAVLFLLGLLPETVTFVVGEVHWYLAFLPIIWSAFWNRLEGAIVASLAVCSGATWLLDLSVTSLRFHEIQLLIVLFSGTGLLMGAVLAARSASERLYQDRNRQLLAVREELEQRNRELAMRNAEMGRFVNVASHELKSPLVTIAGFLGRLRRNSEKLGWQGIGGDLDRIQTATRTMEGLLDGLLEYSRVASWPADREIVDLGRAVEQALARLEAADILTPDRRREILTVAEDLPRIIGQRLWIEELLEHLIDNAIRFTRDVAEPRVEVGWRSTGDATVVAVRDNGLGIDPRYHERVFDLFERLDPQLGGRGLGLALARRIAEAQGGRIWIESEGRGRGTTVCFTVQEASS